MFAATLPVERGTSYIRLRWGIKTAQQHTTYDAMLAVWQEADRTSAFEHAWLFDHFAPIQGDLDGPCFEGWTLLAALAAQTARLRLGLMVAGNTYRHPAVHAHMAATVDVISHGRLDFGVGAGWNEYEHQSMGIPLYAPGERIRRLGEACEITRRLWTQQLTDFAGRYYQLNQARCEPKPIQEPYPPSSSVAVASSSPCASWRATPTSGTPRPPTWRNSGTRCASCTSTAPRLAAIPHRSNCRCRRGSTTTTSRRRSPRFSRSSRPAPPTSS